jgi:hypothetical protein
VVEGSNIDAGNSIGASLERIVSPATISTIVVWPLLMNCCAAMSNDRHIPADAVTLEKIGKCGPTNVPCEMHGTADPQSKLAMQGYEVDKDTAEVGMRLIWPTAPTRGQRKKFN